MRGVNNFQVRAEPAEPERLCLWAPAETFSLSGFPGRTDLHDGHSAEYKSDNEDCWWIPACNLALARPFKQGDRFIDDDGDAGEILKVRRDGKAAIVLFDDPSFDVIEDMPIADLRHDDGEEGATIADLKAELDAAEGLDAYLPSLAEEAGRDDEPEAFPFPVGLDLEDEAESDALGAVILRNLRDVLAKAGRR